MRNGTGSQWRTSRRSGVMWSYFLLLQMSLAAALSTNWSPSRRHTGTPASRLLQRSTRGEVTKAATATFSSPRGSDLMQLLMRRSWRKQQPTVHATWRLMDRSDSSRTPRSRTEVEGRIKVQQTLKLTGVKMDAPSTGRAPEEVRLLGVESQSVGTHRRFSQHQAPDDAAAVELLMEGPTCKAESHRHRSEMIGRDSQQSHPGRRCRAGTAAARARNPEGRHSRESRRLKGPRHRGLSVGCRRDRAVERIPYVLDKRSARTSWSTVSKAAERSSRPSRAWSPTSIASVISVTAFSRAVSVE